MCKLLTPPRVHSSLSLVLLTLAMACSSARSPADSGNVAIDASGESDGGRVPDAGILDGAVVRDGGRGRGDAGIADAATDGAVSLDAARPDARPNIVFVTSDRHVVGSLGGLSAGDAICQARASNAGLQGSFIAFLSTDTARADQRLTGSRGWVRVDGEPVLDEGSDILIGKVYYPPSLDEHGNRAVLEVDSGSNWDDEDEVATGWQVPATTDNNCANWTSTADSVRAGIGISDFGYARWAHEGTRRCSKALRIYCFEVGNHNPLPPTPPTGRLAFTSGSWLSSGAGIAAFDTACSAEAASAGLSGAFKALVAADGVAAADRFAEGAGWVRPDGVTVFGSLAQMRTQTYPSAPIAVTASLQYGTDENGGLLADVVWTGAASVTTAGTSLSTCESWQSVSSTGSPLAGYSGEGNRDWFSDRVTGSCIDNGVARIYCFQE